MTLRRHRLLGRRRAGFLLPLLLLVPAAPALAQDTGDQHSGTGDQHSGGDEHSGGDTDQGPHDSPTTTAAPTTTAPPGAPEPEDDPDPVGDTDEPPTTPATSAPTTTPETSTPETSTPATTTPATTTPDGPPGGSLPVTGGDVRGLAAIGLGIATAGAALVLMSRRGTGAET